MMLILPISLLLPTAVAALYLKLPYATVAAYFYANFRLLLFSADVADFLTEIFF